MKFVALFSRFGAPCVVSLFLAASLTVAAAQTAPDSVSVAPTPTPEQLSEAELLKSYLQVREQLHATQIAVVNNRVEAETSARVQAAAIAEKLDAIKAAMAAERERHQVETQRLNLERERQQIESQRSLRTVLWVAGAFGGLGLLAMLILPLIQWRAISRMAETAASMRSQLPPPAPIGLLGGEQGTLADPTVALSNQRLTSVIERMERRILELEQTTSHPLTSATVATTGGSVASPTTAASTLSDSDAAPRNTTSDHAARNSTVAVEPSRNGASGDHAARVAMLLGKAKTLATTNKAKEALACYDEILKLDPHHVDALVKKGAALERLMRNEDAIRCYEQAIEIDPKMTLAYLYKGGVCNRLGRYDEALECYEQALQVQEAGK